MSKKVLLLVDVINPLNFVTASQLVPEAFTAARSIAKLKARLSKQGVCAIYANDNYGTASFATSFRLVARFREKEAK